MHPFEELSPRQQAYFHPDTMRDAIIAWVRTLLPPRLAALFQHHWLANVSYRRKDRSPLKNEVGAIGFSVPETVYIDAHPGLELPHNIPEHSRTVRIDLASLIGRELDRERLRIHTQLYSGKFIRFEVELQGGYNGRYERYFSESYIMGGLAAVELRETGPTLAELQHMIKRRKAKTKTKSKGAVKRE